MYSINYNVINTGYLAEMNYVDNGFVLGSRNKVFKIAGMAVKNIIIYTKRLASVLVTEKVTTKFQKLVVLLTELLVDDDDSGDTFREALNHIEKFRLEIKNKYRNYLKQKELEMMSKQLSSLQKVANERLLEIHNSYLESLDNENRRSR
jgi:hypoxanthine phosphoribosyltransferase